MVTLASHRLSARLIPPADVSIAAPDGSFVLHGRRCNYNRQGVGILTIKSFAGGRAQYAADAMIFEKRAFAVGAMLVTTPSWRNGTTLEGACR